MCWADFITFSDSQMWLYGKNKMRHFWSLCLKPKHLNTVWPRRACTSRKKGVNWLLCAREELSTKLIFKPQGIWLEDHNSKSHSETKPTDASSCLTLSAQTPEDLRSLVKLIEYLGAQTDPIYTQTQMNGSGPNVCLFSNWGIDQTDSFQGWVERTFLLLSQAPFFPTRP